MKKISFLITALISFTPLFANADNSPVVGAYDGISSAFTRTCGIKVLSNTADVVEAMSIPSPDRDGPSVECESPEIFKFKCGLVSSKPNWCVSGNAVLVKENTNHFMYVGFHSRVFIDYTLVK